MTAASRPGVSVPIYLDHHATTPCAEAVLEAMWPWFRERFGNAGSDRHTFGIEARAAVGLARKRVAAALAVPDDSILFTSGATESDNLAIFGIADAVGQPGHMVSCATEHEAVVQPMRALERRGWSITWLTPDPQGRITPEQVEAALRDDTALVSLMTANNEIGTIHPIRDIAAVCHARGVLLHSDATQALGKLDLTHLDADLISLSGHKAYGPKGVGALYVRRRGRPAIPLVARQLGGGQERGLRAGTLPVPLLVGFGAAAHLVTHELGSEPARLAALRDQLIDGLLAIEGCTLTGPRDARLPHNVHVRFTQVGGSELLSALRPEVAASSGSACSTGSSEPSHVLTAIGLSRDDAAGSLRLGLGRDTTPEQVVRALDAITRSVASVRASRR